MLKERIVCHGSSGVEQGFCKAQAVGSNPTRGTT